MHFHELRTANVARCEQVFHPVNDWTPLEWAGCMAGEAGETANAAKKLKRLETRTNTAKDPQTPEAAIAMIAKEAADTVIYADLLCARVGVDLGAAVAAKFNEVSVLRKASIFLPDEFTVAGCMWQRADQSGDDWETGCKNAFAIIGGDTPQACEMKYCPFCGQGILQLTAAEGNE